MPCRQPCVLGPKASFLRSPSRQSSSVVPRASRAGQLADGGDDNRPANLTPILGCVCCRALSLERRVQRYALGERCSARAGCMPLLAVKERRVSRHAQRSVCSALQFQARRSPTAARAAAAAPALVAQAGPRARRVPAATAATAALLEPTRPTAAAAAAAARAPPAAPAAKAARLGVRVAMAAKQRERPALRARPGPTKEEAVAAVALTAT
jgi:hypothetical protein